MRLSKHHGLGNDFLVVLDQGDATAELARRLCHRRRGIGADGLMSGCTPQPSLGRGSPGRASPSAPDVVPGTVPDVVMVLRNADGSRAEMSGNGIRCLAQAVLRLRGEVSGTVTIDTDAGIRCVTIAAGDRPSVSLAEVDLGPARPGPAWARQLPAGLLAALGTSTLRAETVDLGNPHLVIEAADPAVVDLAHFGPLLEAAFPRGVNVELVGPRVGRLDELDVAVWERGVGITDACGTGACASATAANRWGLVGRDVTVHLPGGAVGVHLGATLTLRGDVVHIADIDVAEVEADDDLGAGSDPVDIGVPGGAGGGEDGHRDDREDTGG